MLVINITNVEKLIFYNTEIHKLFPEFNQMFKLWKSGKMFGINSLSKQILLDFLNFINNTHIEILKNYFKTDIKIDNIDYHLIKDFKIPIIDADCIICGLKGYRNFTIYRDDTHLYILHWR